MRIINVGQLINLESHSGMLNQFTVRLDSGREVVVITDENTVAQLVDAAAKELGQSEPLVGAPEVPGPEEPAGVEFGGDTPDPGESLATPSLGTVEELPDYQRDKLGQEIVRPPDRRSALGAGHPNKRGRVSRYRTVEPVPARTVPMDERGNPVVPAAHRVENQPEPATEDEDGTSI